MITNLHSKLFMTLLLTNQIADIGAAERSFTQTNNQSYFSSTINWITSLFTHGNSSQAIPTISDPYEEEKRTIAKYYESCTLLNGLKKKFDSVSQDLKIQAGTIGIATGLLPELVAIILEYDHEFTAHCRATLSGHEGPIVMLLALPNEMFASISLDKSIKIWNPNNSPGHECVRILQGHKAKINSMALLSDGKLISVSDDHTIKVCDLSKSCDSECIHTFLGESGTAIRVLPNGMIALAEDSEIVIKKINYNSQSLDHVHSFKDNLIFYPNSIEILPNGLIASISGNPRCDAVKIWNSYHVDRDAKYCNGYYLPREKECLEASYEDHEYGYDSFGGRIYRDREKKNKPLVILSNKTLAAGTDKNEIMIWGLDFSGTDRRISGHSGRVTALATTSDKLLVSGSEDCTIKIWDPSKNYQCIHTLIGHKAPITTLITLHKMIISGSSDGIIKIWD